METFGHWLFKLGSVLGFLCAKFKRGWDSRYDPDRPGYWK